jgi:hypothetical protein
MYGTYGSMVGFVNIIFTIAMVLLTFKYWAQVNLGIKILLIIGIGIFTVIQPSLVYLKANKQVRKVPGEIELSFNEKGVHIKTEQEFSHIEWKSIKGMSQKPGMLVLIASSRHGFILTDDVLGAQKDEFYHYVTSKIEHK